MVFFLKALELTEQLQFRSSCVRNGNLFQSSLPGSGLLSKPREENLTTMAAQKRRYRDNEMTPLDGEMCENFISSALSVMMDFEHSVAFCELLRQFF